MNAGQFDIAILGSGFGGSIMAMIARRLGYSVLLVERGKHPRFAIGESSTPLANLLLEEIARRYDLPALLPLTKWGSWQRTYPEIGCGLKRGFTFFKHEWDKPFVASSDRSNQLLVAASPHDDIADTHWFRADFDAFLVKQAIELGANYFDETEIRAIEREHRSSLLTGSRNGDVFEARARFVIDATGPRGVLHRLLSLGERLVEHLGETEALFTHFEEVTLFDFPTGAKTSPPYPPDAAALHHVFEGGWIWVLRFNNGITSAGVAVSKPNGLNLHEGECAWLNLLSRLPSVQQQFRAARPVRPFVHVSRLGFKSEKVAGDGWALLPSAAGFIDPLLSTGFPLTLLGVLRLAEIFEGVADVSEVSGKLGAYENLTFREVDAAEKIVAALYKNFTNFSRFIPLSLLYFAAASYSEVQARLGRPRGEFLLSNDPRFSALLNDACSAGANADVESMVRARLEPYDIAGLVDRSRQNWHPVLASDLMAAATKLNASEADLRQLLLRSGFEK